VKKHSDLKAKPLEFFESMLSQRTTGQTTMKRFVKINHKSYLISLRIAKTCKPHTIGETLILPSIKDTVKVFFGDKSDQQIENIPMSNNTVTRMIDEMSLWVENRLIESS
jgi:hypothetical protein